MRLVVNVTHRKLTREKEARQPLCTRLGATQGHFAQVQRISLPPAFMFFVFSFTLYFICTWFSISIILRFYFFIFTCNTQRTDIHAPGGIRNRNPSKRSAADPHFRRLSHWGSAEFDPWIVQPLAIRYTG